MIKIRDVLRLRHESHLTERQIAATVGVSRSTVQQCLGRAHAAAIGWPLPADLDEAQLRTRLYPQPERAAASVPPPDFAHVHQELKRPGVTRDLLWREYLTQHPEGLRYTAFCNHYRRWLRRQDLVLRQDHVAGDKLFVDYAGHTVPIIDRYSGEARAAQIFVAVLGMRNYTYAEASLTQQLPDWLASHGRAFDYFGGAPRAIVPDNLKSAVTKARRYEPDLNRAYQQFAEH